MKLTAKQAQVYQQIGANAYHLGMERMSSRDTALAMLLAYSDDQTSIEAQENWYRGWDLANLNDAD